MSDYPPSSPRPTKQGLTALDGALALIAILLIAQMWLLTATLESFLAGHHEAALPGAIISGLLFLASFGLYIFVDRIDSAARKPVPHEPADSSREKSQL